MAWFLERVAGEVRLGAARSKSVSIFRVGLMWPEKGGGDVNRTGYEISGETAMCAILYICMKHATRGRTSCIVVEIEHS